MSSPIYIIDASVFIEAARRYYAFDLVPPFWEALIEHAEEGRVRSIDRVKRELNRGNDELTKWANTRFVNAFSSTDEEVIINWYRQIITWVEYHGQFVNAAKANFAKGADGWLVAYAKEKGCIVVTQEVLSPDAKKKVPIPNVCQAFDVHCVDTFTMLRELGVRF